jgi:diacylglycerol kinase (ATP)
MNRRALLLVNRHSRRGADAEPVARAALEERGFDLTIPEGDIGPSAAIRAHAAWVDLVIVGGGDGSLNAAIPGLLDTGLPLGVIPLGTGNDFARTLDIPLDISQAVRVIAAGHVKRVDVGEANGHPFLNVASIGFGVDLTRALQRDAKRRWGVFGYAIAGLRVLRRLRPFTARIEHGGQTYVSRTVHVAIGNGRHYGGGMVVDFDARLDDARLHAFSLEVGHWWRLLRLLPALRSGSHSAWAEVRTLAGEEVTVRTRRARSVNTDGEITTHTPVTFRVRPAVLGVFVP